MRKVVVTIATVLLSACGENDPNTGLGATQDAIQRLVEQQERERQAREQPRQPTNRENEAGAQRGRSTTE